MFNRIDVPTVVNEDLVVLTKLTETQLERVVAEVGLVINIGDNTYIPKEWSYVLMSEEKRRIVLVMYFTKMLVDHVDYPEDLEQYFNDLNYVSNLENKVSDVIDYLNNQDYDVHSILGGE